MPIEVRANSNTYAAAFCWLEPAYSIASTTNRNAAVFAVNFQRVRFGRIELTLGHGHSPEETFGNSAAALTRLLDIMPETMTHHRNAHRLDVFRQNHVAPVHQRPCLGGVKQSEAGSRR